ncbi:hypothetical protein [Mycobacterium sp.]|uniref:hypothetical protein n=1 Tax=Mycobacterium sp. TaxID=1785 RepID=UPI003F9819BF
MARDGWASIRAPPPGVGTTDGMLWEGHRRADQGGQTIVLAALELDGIGDDEPPWPALIAADNSGVSAPRRRAEFAFRAATAQH